MFVAPDSRYDVVSRGSSTISASFETPPLENVTLSVNDAGDKYLDFCLSFMKDLMSFFTIGRLILH